MASVVRSGLLWALLATALAGCPPTQTGTPCTYTSQCPGTQVCAGGVCRNQCLVNRDCAGGLVCLDGTCTSLAGDAAPPPDGAPDAAPTDTAPGDTLVDTAPDAAADADATLPDSAPGDATPPMDARADAPFDSASDAPTADVPRADVPPADGSIMCPSDGSTCVPTVPPTEVCDGVDNDCNGVVDETDPGAGAACTPLGGACVTGGTLHCTGGMLRCVGTGFAGAGTSCGAGLTCDGNGQCGGACVPGAPCRLPPTTPSALECDFGFRDCTPGLPNSCVRSHKSAGTHCDMGVPTATYTCNGHGTCTQCTYGLSPCYPDPSNHCTVGTTAGSACLMGLYGCINPHPERRGVAACSAPGMVCDTCGGCTESCSPGVCTPPAGPCFRGWLHCDTGGGPPACADPIDFQPAGTPCPGGTCDGRGACH